MSQSSTPPRFFEKNSTRINAMTQDSVIEQSVTQNTPKQTDTAISQRRVLPWLMCFLKPYKTQVIAAIIFLLIGSLAWLCLGQGVKLLVDKGFENSQALNQALLLILFISLINASAAFCRFFLMSWLGERVSADIRLKVYDQLLNLSPAFYAKTRTGEVISRFTADTTLLQTVVGSSFSMALRASVTIIGGLVMMALTNIKLMLLVVVAVPIVILPVKILSKKVRRLARLSQDKMADLGAYVDESLHEIHTVQSYGHQEQDRQLFKSHTDAIIKAAKSRISYRSILIASVMLLSMSAMILVTWIGALDVLKGELTAGQLSAFMFYAVLVAGSVSTISEVIGDVQRAAGATERLIELAESQSEIISPINPIPLPTKIKGKIQFSNLSFAYSSNTPVLNQLSLEIKAGERIALVGPSGAGKSTLLNLLQRFYNPTKGEITIDGIDISQISLNALRKQFALVPQESVIFATNVIENVRYGRINATDEEVKAACIAAKADEFITQFTEGYDTYLGERGIRLSGGQKQRIAIARAILADRPILLLDEATSSLDAKSELYVKDALDVLMQNKTTIVIAHRLSTVINADRIIVMDEGKIVATGKHQQLIKTNELYKEFASLQLLTKND